MKYYLLCRNLNKYQMLPVDEDPYHHISKHPFSDWYTSVYQFDEKHKQQFDDTLLDFERHPEKYTNENGEVKRPGGHAGLTGGVTNKLSFDMDSAKDLELARQDTLTLLDRLKTHGVPIESIEIYYSGGKGFTVSVSLDVDLTSAQHKELATKIAGDLDSFDTTLYNDVRVLRLPLTRHQKTGHYKIPIATDALEHYTIPEIQAAAQNREYISSIEPEDLVNIPCSVPDSLKASTFVKPKVNEPMVLDISDIDWSTKPKWLSNCKFALYKGLFPGGTRDHFFTVMAATFKTQFPDDKAMVYRMLKSVAENQANQNNCERKPDKDLWLKVEQVFKPTWKGGTYTCKTDETLKKLCDGLGNHKCDRNAKENVVHDITSLSKIFNEYATTIDANTIQLGISAIDENVRVTSGMHIGLLASPGAGKTSALLNVLNHTSKSGIKSFFFSMDMYAPLIYQKQLHNISGYTDKKLFSMMRENSPEMQKLDNTLLNEYENVRFCFKSGLTVEDIRQTVLEHQEQTGEQIKLIAIDYAECITDKFSDAFNNSKMIAHKLKDLASQDGFCVITLVQPPKVAGDAGTPLYSMRQVKGPSDWEQGFSVIIGMYREGYNPNTSENDKYATFVSLKNRMGGMFKVDCAWNGLRGSISDLDADGEADLADLRKRKASGEFQSWGQNNVVRAF